MADTPDEKRWGTIFMGPTPNRESTIDKVTENRQREVWNRRTEAEYMERVRAKATLRVQVMLDQARGQAEAIRGTARQWAEKLRLETEDRHEQADRIRQEAEQVLAEAEQQRERGWQEGYRQGAEQALLELEQQRAALEDATASILRTIEEQNAVLFGAWREELAGLLRDAVECATGWILNEERSRILERLLVDSVRELTERRRLVVRVNPGDSQAVSMIFDGVRERFPDLENWEIHPDERIEPCGLMVESSSGMIDNRQQNRRQVVEEVLRRLTLPPGPADTAAQAAIAQEMERTGIGALADQAVARAAAQAETLAEPEPETETPVALSAEISPEPENETENETENGIPTATEEAGAVPSPVPEEILSEEALPEAMPLKETLPEEHRPEETLPETVPAPSSPDLPDMADIPDALPFPENSPVLVPEVEAAPPDRSVQTSPPSPVS